MPRTVRASVGDICYHVINRGNGRGLVFRRDEDFAAFVGIMGSAVERIGTRVLGYCLMPNHFHLILWPRADGELGRFMQWLSTSHVRRHHGVYRTSGHVWQGRFKAFPIQDDDHLLTVLRYVERNPLRARLVRRAEKWRWSSAGARVRDRQVGFLTVGPVERPADWLQFVNEPQTEKELEAVRVSVVRGAPYGEGPWRAATAARLGIGASLNPRGRPRKPPRPTGQK